MKRPLFGDGSLQRAMTEALGTAMRNGKDIPAEKVSEIIRKAVPSGAQVITRSLLANTAQMLRERRREEALFRGRLAKVWKRPFDLLQALCVMSYEIGSDYNSLHRKNAARRNDAVFEALIRLHAQGTLIAHEVLTLTRAGLASGAMARWRALHETTTVALLIADTGKDLAERYLLHKHVDARKALREHQTHSSALGQRPFSKREAERIQKTAEELEKRFGRDYRNDFGWAAHELKNPRPNFSDIEKAAGLGHMRPYYRLSSLGVHPGSRGLYFNLGVHPLVEVLLAGPSNAGLADALQCTALSLTQLNAPLLCKSGSLDDLVAFSVLQQFSNLIEKAAIKAHRYVERETLARIRSTRRK